MKKGIVCLLLLSLLFSLCGFAPNRLASARTADGSFSGGSGTEEDPYRIASAEDLRALQKLAEQRSYKPENPYRKAHYLLTADVDLGGKDDPWTPIGDNHDLDGSAQFPFEGVFDGGGHTVSGLYIEYKSDSLFTRPQFGFGLFGRVENGTVKNLTVADSSIAVTGSKLSPNVGAIAGEINNAAIENCRVLASVSLAGPYAVGGVVGYTSDTLGLTVIRDCASAAQLSSTGQYGELGGITAVSFGSLINCVNDGDITGYELGGIACTAFADITGCVNNGSLHAKRAGAGIVSRFSDGALNPSMVKAVKIADCRNTGDVTVEDGDAGGIAGKISAGVIENCENTGAIRGYLSAGGIFAQAVFERMIGPTAAGAAIRGCINSGAVAASSENGAGFLGGIGGAITSVMTDLTIEDCRNSGPVGTREKLKGKAGGIVGAFTHGVSDGEGEMKLLLRGCENTAEICGGSYGTGGIAGSVSTAKSGARLLLTVSDCVNGGDVHSASLLCRSGGILGEIDCLNSYSEITGCTNTGSLASEYELVPSAGRWYHYTCVLGGIVGHIGSNTNQINPADSEIVTEGEPVARFSGCRSTGTLTTYADDGVTYYTDDVCARSDFPILVED